MPTDVSAAGKLNSSSMLLEKAPSPISTTESGMLTLTNLLSENKKDFIEESEFDIWTSDMSLSQNAL